MDVSKLEKDQMALNERQSMGFAWSKA